MIIVQILVFSSILLFPSSYAALSNVTIDDQIGDPTNGLQINYNPPDAWKGGQTCSACSAKVTPASDAWMGTWMDATYYPPGTSTKNISGQIIQAFVPFVGVAVYVNVIITGSIEDANGTYPDGNSDYTFFLDNNIEGVFQKAPDGDPKYYFNQTVFSKEGLNNSLHTLKIEAGHSGQKALVLLDSVIYTTDDGSSENISATSGVSPAAATSSVGSASSSSTRIGIIVGPIIAVVIVLAVIIAFLYRRWQRKNDTDDHYNLADSESSNSPRSNHDIHMSEAEARPYFITSGGTGPSKNMSSTNQPDSNLNNNQSRALSFNMIGSAHIQNTPRPEDNAQLSAITVNDEGGSGSVTVSPPSYKDVDHGPSPSDALSRPQPVPLRKD